MSELRIYEGSGKQVATHESFEDIRSIWDRSAYSSSVGKRAVRGRHWFDTGPRPRFKAIRLFTTPQGWVAYCTGDKIAGRFPRLEEPHYHLPQAA